MTHIRIVKDLPPPKEVNWTRPGPDANPPGRKPTYPFADMEVGDCMLIPRDMGHTSEGNCRRTKTVRASASAWRKRSGNTDWRFLVRLVDKDTVGCWRVA